MEKEVREFFRQRIGEKITVPSHLCPRHTQCTLYIKKVVAKTLYAASVEKGTDVELSLDGYDSPSSVMADIVRIVSGLKPEGKRTAHAVFANAKLEKAKLAIQKLMAGDGLSAGEVPPTEGACLRFLEILREEPRLILPDIFGSKDGTMRTRWRHGKTTIWAKISEKPEISWVAWISRDGGKARSLNAHTQSFDDFVFFASALGVPILNLEF